MARACPHIYIRMHDGTGLNPTPHISSGFMDVLFSNHHQFVSLFLSWSLLFISCMHLRGPCTSAPHVYQLQGTGSLSIDGRIVQTFPPLLLPNVTTQTGSLFSSPCPFILSWHLRWNLCTPWLPNINLSLYWSIASSWKKNSDPPTSLYIYRHHITMWQIKLPLAFYMMATILWIQNI